MVAGCSDCGKNMKAEFPIEPLKAYSRLNREFYTRDVLKVAPDLLGKNLVIHPPHGSILKLEIEEVEAYRGEEDKACHACRGRTHRNRVMYGEGGKVYVYFVYGMYWMLNFVTGKENNPQAVLIRGLNGLSGPGRLTRDLGINGEFYGEDLTISDRIWVEESGEKCKYVTKPRFGIDYAGDPWRDKPWRFIIKK